MTMRNHIIALLLILFSAKANYAQQPVVSQENPMQISRRDCINLSIRFVFPKPYNLNQN